MKTQTSSTVVWFNKGLSAVAQAIQGLKAESINYKTICSHTNTHFCGFEHADLAIEEPTGLTGDEYVNWALSICDEYGVDVFWPSRYQREITSQRGAFEARGIAVITPASQRTLDLIEDKSSLYETVKDCAPIPTTFVASDYTTFWYAYQAVRASSDKVCIKPTTGIFAQGFRAIHEGQNLIETIMKNDEYSVDFESLNTSLRSYGDEKFPFKFMVMQYLSGAELSCDCVASKGQLIACVVREKPTEAGNGQQIVDNPVVEQVITDIVTKLRLDGPFNIQFKYQDGEPYLLEINPRMSGGIHISCASGINLPAIAIEAALNDSESPVELKTGQYGTRVHDTPTAVVFTTKKGDVKCKH